MLHDYFNERAADWDSQAAEKDERQARADGGTAGH